MQPRRRQFSQALVVAVVLNGLLPIAGAFLPAVLATASPASIPPEDGWGQPTPLSFGRTDIVSQTVASDFRGNATAAWVHGPFIEVSRLSVGTGWNVPVKLGFFQNQSNDPDVAMGGQGEAIVVFRQSANFGAFNNVFVARYDPTAGWEPTLMLQADGAISAGGAVVGMDTAGNAVAIWSQIDGSGTDIWARTYTSGLGWGVPVVVRADPSYDQSLADLAVDAGGNATAVWQVFSPGHSDIMSARYTPAGGWGAAALLENDDAGNAAGPQVAASEAGGALAVWNQENGSAGNYTSNILSSQFVPASGWSAPEFIEWNDSGRAFRPRLDANANGQAIVGWQMRVVGGGHPDSWATRFDPGTGWGTPELISDGVNWSDWARTAIDEEGNGLATWISYGAGTDLWSRRFLVGAGWQPASLAEYNNTSMVYDGGLVYEGFGNYTAVWQDTNGTTLNRTIYANRYVGFDFTPPFLVIDSPADATNVSTASVEVVGRTEPGAALVVQGFLVAVAPNGSFCVRLALAPGATLIEAFATDGVGNSATASVNVTFVDPLVDLVRQIEGLRAALNSTQAVLATVWLQLNVSLLESATIWSQLNATAMRLQAVNDTLLAVIEGLNDTQSDINRTMVTLSLLQATVSQALDELSTIQADISLLQARIAAAAAAAAAAQAHTNETDDRLSEALKDLNDTRSDLAETELELQRTKDDLNTTQGEVSALASRLETVTLFAALAILAAVAVPLVLRRRQEPPIQVPETPKGLRPPRP